MKPYGKVWITGAGPGDEELLTVKAKSVIERADVVVYDALVSPEIMSMVPEHTRKVNVGKRSSRHLMPQEEINHILVRLAKEGNQVVRLKGGDPFVFGRGGEELELLEKEGISYEVIPGVTSALSALSYAGIPVTHRDFTSSFHVITGHPRQGGTSRVDYEALVNTKGTLIFLMGVSSMEEICRCLIEAGMDPQMPAAVVENGTTARQRQVTGTISTITEMAKEAQIRTPAVIAVGKVCQLSNEFAWSDRRPLGGKRIVVTRPRCRMEHIAFKLREYGAQVIEFPVIRMEAMPMEGILSEAALGIAGSEKKEEWIVFTSPSGVEIFFEQMTGNGIDFRRILSGTAEVKIAAIGSATERKLRERGLLADLVPQEYTAKALGEALQKEADADSHVTVFRAKEGSKLLLPPLSERGIPWDDIALYETVKQDNAEIEGKVKELLSGGEIDAVTFTSASTVDAFAEKMAGIDYSLIRAACIGEQTAKAAKRYGMRIFTASQADEDRLIELILGLE